MSWEKIDETVYHLALNMSGADYKKVAIFDLDYTLVKPRGKRIHPKDADDWEWLNNSVKSKLINLQDSGYKMFIVSNQSGLKNMDKDTNEPCKQYILDRIINICAELDTNDSVELECYVAADEDINRKPNTAIFEKHIFPKLSKDFSDLVYVGDAAGRESDFSDSDRKFAFNIHLYLKYLNIANDIKYFTPEEYFLGKEEKGAKKWSGFDPHKFLYIHKDDKFDFDQVVKFNKDEQNIFILIGPPASGKSTLAKVIRKKLLKSGTICQDNCGSRAKCIQQFKYYLAKKSSIIVDNTNPSAMSRAEYIELAKIASKEIKIYFLVMQVNEDFAKHLNVYRERTTGRKCIPAIAYKMYYKKYDEPEIKEGADAIYNIPFVFKAGSRLDVLRFLQRS